MEQKSSKKTRSVWLLLIGIVVLSVAMVMIPAILIFPFRRQTPFGVELSYALRRWTPMLTIVALMAAISFCVLLWRRSRSWLGKAAMIALLIPLLGAVWFARQNHFEWMFQPLTDAAYARISEADFVADREMVMTVELSGEAVAYPVRQMAYHHVINDVVGGTPVAATY
jgi:hypothetical protein